MLGKSLQFYLIVFVKYTLIVALPLGELETTTAIDFMSISNAKLHAEGLDDNASNNDTSLDSNYDGRIVGGHTISIILYPYQVSLQYHKSHICGGSILTHNVILTAAHCIEEPQDVAAFQVRAGSSSHLRGGQLFKVHRIIKHENYTLTSLDGDVALVVLAKNLTFSRSVMPIALPGNEEEIPDTQPLLVSGWGLTSETGSVSSSLNAVAVRLINRHKCEQSYQYVATITRQMFCAGHPQGGKDSCQGDSGGPLVSYVATKPSSSPAATTQPLLTTWQSATSNGLIAKPIQYGIVSWGVGCAQKDYPGVYANVAALRPWIDKNLEEIKKILIEN